MTRILLMSALALPLQDPGDKQDAPLDYAKILKDAKITLAEACDRALKESPGGVVTAAAIETDDDGKPRYYVHVAKRTKTLMVCLDMAKGEVLVKEEQDEDDSKTVAAAKITLKKAIEIALKKVSGKAIGADLDLGEEGGPEAQVDVFSEGQITEVLVDAKTGEVVSVTRK